MPNGRARRAGRLVEVDDPFLRGDERRERGDRLRHRGEPNGARRVATRRATPSASTTPAAAKSTGQPSIWRSACTRGDTSHAWSGETSPGPARTSRSSATRVPSSSATACTSSGTAANPADGSPPPEDIYDQTRVCLELIGTALEQAGSEPAERRAHACLPRERGRLRRLRSRARGGVRRRAAANTTVLAGLFDPRWKVEIEVEAVLP